MHSTSNAGKKVSDIHTDLLGEIDYEFADKITPETIDVVFLCMGHGKSRELFDNYPMTRFDKVIDLSRDYRLKADAENFIYGLPELNKDKIQDTNHFF